MMKNVAFGSLALLTWLLTAAPAQAQILTGDYTGDGAASRIITDVGFQPDVVIVKGNNAQTAVIRTSTMAGDAAKPMTGATILTANLVESLDGGAGNNGFTVGGDARVNANTIAYHFVAFKQAAKRLKVGTYNGNGVAGGQAITGVGFSPEFVIVMSAGAAEAVFRPVSDTETFNFSTSTGDATTLITVLGADGFTLGSADARVNAAATVYHYIAWNEVAGVMDVGTYTGDGVNGRNLAGPLFKPEFLLIKADAGSNAVMHTNSQGPIVDSSLFASANINAADRIQQLRQDGFQVGQAAEVNTNLVVYNYIAFRREIAETQVLSGTYTGNGLDNRPITGLGFAPDVVIVKASTNQEAVLRTDSRFLDFSKDMSAGTVLANRIQTLDAEGFTVGTDARVNTNGVIYYWTAWQMGVGEMAISNYTGNGAVGRQITDLGFSPDVVWILSAGADVPVHRISAGANTFTFDGVSSAGAWITALGADGFTVDANARVNANGTLYYYIAWNEIAGKMDVGTYTGNAPTDSRNITGVGFQPEFVYTQSNNTRPPVAHSDAMGAATDTSHYFNLTANAANNIQALQADGFQVGSGADVNENLRTFVYAAWMQPAVTAVKLISFSAIRDKTTPRTIIEWRTGYEIDNLGFNVYRETDGQRTRLTGVPVVGSGLLVGPAVAYTAPHAYTWIDTDNVDGAYWLEDIDFSGKSTWHGPISARRARADESPRQTPSTLMSHLGRPSGRRASAPRPTRVEGAGRQATAAAPAASVAGAPKGATAPSVSNAGSSASASTAATDPVQPVVAALLPVDDGHSHMEAARPGRRGPDPEMLQQRAIAAASGAKLLVRAAGWYRVAQAPLVAAGLRRALDPRRLAVFVDGVEQAIVVRGEADGRFDAGDSIEFYGTGVDTPYTDTRVYWVVEGRTAGRRIRLADRAAGGGDRPSNFPSTVERKDRTIFFAALQNGEKENFFGELIYPGFATDQTLDLVHVDTDATGYGSLEVVLQGVTQPDGGATDHQVGVRLNGVDLGEVVFDGRGQGERTFPVDLSLLAEGTNTVTLEAYGGDDDVTLVDHIRLTYRRRYVADGNSLSFTAEGRQEITIAGFSAAARVLDVTNPATPNEVLSAASSVASGGSVVFTAPGTGLRRMVAVTDAGALAPADIVPNAPSSYHLGTRPGDIVMIAHRLFLDSLQPLKTYRERQGHTVTVVDVEDVYDEFSFGEKTPYALRDFMTFAKVSWRIRPEFLLLVGNATNDPRDYYGFGEPDFVPTKNVTMSVLESASDDWFADADDDGRAELAVGRLPVRTVEQAATMVSKIIGYERAGGGAWNKSVLLVAEVSEAGDADFLGASNRLRQAVPSNYTVKRIDRAQMEVDEARADLIDRINEGQLLVTYAGHGSVDAWKNELFSATDAASLTNGMRLPFVIAMNCLNGLFNALFPEESLAEALVRAESGGAVAVWASSAVTSPRAQEVMTQELYRLVFSGAARTLGEAVLAAKAATGNADVRRSYVFFGDPAMRLNGVPYAPTSHTPGERGRASESASRSQDAAGADASEGEELFLPIDYDTTQARRLGDFDGDGVDDLFWYSRAGEWRVTLSRNARSQTGHWSPGLEPFAADFNGDHVSDLFLYGRDTGAWFQGINNGRAEFTFQGGSWRQDGDVSVGDFNGDGRDDVLLHHRATGKWFQGLADGLGGFVSRSGSWAVEGVSRVGDFNGDNRADVLTYSRESGAWSLATGSADGRFTMNQGFWAPGRIVVPANLNGDHRTDLVFYDPVSGRLAACVTEATTTSSATCATSESAPELVLAFADFSGDGRDDLLLYDPRTGQWTTRVDTAQGTTVVNTGMWAPRMQITTGDPNGDGRADVWLHDVASGRWIFAAAQAGGDFAQQAGSSAPGWSPAGRP